MASTQCFLHHHAISTATTRSKSYRQVSNIKPTSTQLVIRVSQKNSAEEESNAVSVSRRVALTLLIGAAGVGSKVSPADAAYGEGANVFGKQKSTEFKSYKGDGFKLEVPAKWNPSCREIEFPGTVLRYEDNFDATNNLSVMIEEL